MNNESENLIENKQNLNVTDNIEENNVNVQNNVNQYLQNILEEKKDFQIKKDEEKQKVLLEHLINLKER